MRKHFPACGPRCHGAKSVLTRVHVVSEVWADAVWPLVGLSLTRGCHSLAHGPSLAPYCLQAKVSPPLCIQAPEPASLTTASFCRPLTIPKPPLQPELGLGFFCLLAFAHTGPSTCHVLCRFASYPDSACPPRLSQGVPSSVNPSLDLPVAQHRSFSRLHGLRARLSTWAPVMAPFRVRGHADHELCNLQAAPASATASALGTSGYGSRTDLGFDSLSPVYSLWDPGQAVQPLHLSGLIYKLELDTET